LDDPKDEKLLTIFFKMSISYNNHFYSSSFKNDFLIILTAHFTLDLRWVHIRTSPKAPVPRTLPI